jgi:acetyl-CoA acetyltransferase
MAEPVYVIGAGRTDFKRNFMKEGKTIRHIILEASRAALADAGIDPGDIDAGVVGNFAGGLFTRQLHLGAFITEIDDTLRGLPTLHVEAACASGGVAVLTGAQQIMGGLHEVVLVAGAEQQKTMTPAEGAGVLAAAGDYHAEAPLYGEFMFPKLFARIAQIYGERHGLTEEDLARVAFKNRAHARLNPLAQMRDSALTLQEACSEAEGNRRVAPPLKLSDCSPITDGGAAVVLCSESFAKKVMAGRPRERRVAVRLLGFGHTTDYLPLEKKDAPDFSVACKAAAHAYAVSGLRPQDMDAAEVHDCFSISEILACEILGFAPRGQGTKLLEHGATTLPQARALLEIRNPKSEIRNVPINPGGGLMGDGHPVGATGVRQVVSACQQLTGVAGAHQVEGAKRVLTFNMGGSVTTSVVMIWGKES